VAPEEICRLLQSQFGDGLVDTVLEGAHPYAQVAAPHWPEIAVFLRDDARLRFNMQRSISSLDLIADNQLACVYDLMHVPMDQPTELMTETIEFAVRVVVDRDKPVIPSVTGVWPTAEWHEREAYDLMGIVFKGHPDLRRILCPEDWEGHALRKDYEFPLEYHGIPGTTEYELTNPQH
jgi:NADH-quinone oxidoreductase subunit C